ncbi:tyrosine-type recombinase/integrase [Micromonospora sp. MED01]|uniref:tyrosine-type recombinase/integrase n=1 Tax=Micromonospora alfalfae TaxID=2911212 RepID=UPI001EE962C4|nr:tyrosine-type recombinase/integrase [Micromonospora alfalfae]MCG5460876.1 tyrosine-type recombinase/integrase [Micromonospora alfalfae]
MVKRSRPNPGHLRPYIDSFALELRIRGRSERTREMYVDAVSWFAGWLLEHKPVKSWDQVTRKHLGAFFVALDDLDYSDSYRNNIARCLQQFFKWFSLEEDLPNPFDKFVPPSAPKLGTKMVPVLELEQMQALIKDAESLRDFESRRDAAMLRMFACTGVRLGELAGLTLTAVSIADRTAAVTGKGAKQRTVKFDYKCAQALDRYVRVRASHKAAGLPALWLGVRRNEQGMTRSGIYQVIARRGERLGLKLHPHMFRHTFSHRWLDAGGAEGDLMELNGWDSPQMLRHYGASARAARARRAYDRVDVMGGL